LFLEGLGPSITSTDVQKRLDGYTRMIDVLQGLRPNFLTEVQLNFVAEFVRARLKDHSSLMSPTLAGIRALVSYDGPPYSHSLV
jgi:hypothetical protein